MSERRVVRFERFGGPTVLHPTTEALPAPAAGEVLVRVEAIGVNFADTMVRRGEYRRDQSLPDVPGMEVAGRVLESRGDRHRAGDRVAVFLEDGGGYADHVVVREELAFGVHEDVPAPLVAAVFLQGVTAWYAVHRYGRVRAGDTVLVTGAAGGLGALATQLAVEAGAVVIGTASTPRKRQFVLDQGATHAVPADAASLTCAVRALAPAGVDVVLDGVGGVVFAAALAATARNGRLVVVGSASQDPAVVDTRHLLPRGQSIAGFVVRNVMDADPREPAEALRAVLERVADGRLQVPVRTLRLDQAQEAHEQLEARAVTGSLVLLPSGAVA